MANQKRIVDYLEIRSLFDEEYKRKMQLVREGETYLDSMAEGFMGADKVIFMLPPVDAVEVVRCKDCKWYEVHKPRVLENCEREGKLVPMMPDDFCSYGERRG